MKHQGLWTCLMTAGALIVAAATATALEPPTAEQIERYRREGTLAARTDAARSFGDHRMAPQLTARIGSGQTTIKALPEKPTLLPSNGSPRVLALLIAFSDMPGTTDAAVVDDRIFGDGDPGAYPYESLTNFYRRSSYGRLEIAGSTLGWYTTAYPRSEIGESYLGRQALIKEVFTHYDLEGHDFSQYDNDGDGVIDYLVIVWTGPHGEWAEFWWGYQTSFYNDSFTVDGVRIGTYSWQWENYDWPGQFSPEVVIHETGHALGLPDYYDYDDAVGPRGGLGGMDQMDNNWADHNAFSKWVLGWLTPEIFNEDLHDVVLSPTDEFPEAAVFMHGDPVSDPFAEYFMVQSRRQAGNDTELPTQGALVWHIDARVDGNGDFLYDNSYTEHKLIRLMEADGLEEIERGGRADAGDFYATGDVFDTDSHPSSHRYDGVPTNIALGSFAYSWAGPDMLVTADLGSGCALWCDASVSPNAWPGLPVAFNGSLDSENCDGAPSYGWVYGDGASSIDTSATHAYVSSGVYQWTVTAQVDDAVCGHGGAIVVCTDFQCWQWAEIPAMPEARSQQAAVKLDDGRVLVVGGGAPIPEIFDPADRSWSPAAAPTGLYPSPAAVALDDGRVLVVGSDLGDELNAEIFDPDADAWSATGQLNHDRFFHSAITLSDGRVLVAGGVWGEHPQLENVDQVEVFDPASESWTVVGTLPGRRIEPALANLHDGTAVIVGARELTRFDPASDILSRAAPLPADWQQPVAVTLDDGRVLAAGVADSPMTLVWNPGNGKWTIADPAGAIRQGATATKLANGLVVVAGGYGGGDSTLRTTEFFDPVDLTWSDGSSLVRSRSSHTATLLDDGRLLVVGGTSSDAGPHFDPTASVEILTRPASPPRNIGGRTAP